MIPATLVAIVLATIYYTIIKYTFKFIYRNKKSISIRFFKSLLLVIGLTVIVYSYLCQFDATREISKTLLQSGSLIIALATFSCQQVLSNVISGIVISSSKPFDIGDKITLSNGGSPIVTGVVMDINTRHVSIKMADGKVALIANSLVDNYVCINENTLENNGYPFALECTYNSDVGLAMKLMKEQIDAHPLTIETDLLQTNVTCSSLNANGFELKAIIFTKTIADSMKACSDLRVSIFKVWKENGIELPYNTITILRG